MKVKVLIAAMLIGCFVQSCNIINPAEKIPTYIRIDSVTVKTDNYTKTGSTSSKITSAWVYANNSLVGVFDVPARVPILIDGNSIVTIAPGISINGLKDFQAVYPFYSFDTFSVAPSPGNIIPRASKVQYTDIAQFKWMEDFETGSKFQEINAYIDEDTSLVRVTESSKVFEGKASGYIYLNSAHTKSEIINIDDINITKGEAYLEINYKCSIPFEVGLQTTKSASIVYEYIAGAKATDTWKKLYIGLSDFTSRNQGPIYHVMIKTVLPDGTTEGFVSVDNLKVISK